ncbi:MAG TPA: discoidin domain-containing protein, partial [Polyangiaceae bacterium]
MSDNYVIDPADSQGGSSDPGTGGASVGGNMPATGGAGGTGLVGPAGMGGPMPPPMKDAAADAAKEAGPPVIELASGKPATASSEQTSKGNLAGLGNDGIPTTRWSAADATTPKWWRVDLGAAHHISRVEIDWEFPRPYGYLIEVSTNDTTYATLVDRSA